MSDAMTAARSPLNPGDAALMQKSGEAGPNQSFGEFMETSFGIKWETPLQEAGQKLAMAAKNATPVGKVDTMAKMGGQMGGAPPMGQPGMPQKPMPQGRPMAVQGGLESLMGRMG